MKDQRILASIFCVSLAATVWAQNGAKGIKLAPPPHSDPTSGAQMYKDYCASCHGLEGKGDGPAARFFSKSLPDLTTLSERNGGKYPSTQVQAILRFGGPGHTAGPTGMPVWCDVFRSNFNHAPDLRAYAINHFVASLQRSTLKIAKADKP